MATAQELLQQARQSNQIRSYEFPASRINSSDHKTLMIFSEYFLNIDAQTLTPSVDIGQGNKKILNPSVAITLPVPIKIHEPYTIEYESVNLTSLVTQTVLSAINPYGAGYATQQLGRIGSILGPTLGLGINPYTVSKLKNVHLRRHEFFWKLSPQNKQETDDIEAIIDQIRVKMHPKSNMTMTGHIPTPELILGYPELLSFRILGPRNPDHVFPTMPCVVENFTIDRTAADYPTFFAGTGTPTVYGLYLTVKEIMPMVRNAQTDKLSVTVPGL